MAVVDDGVDGKHPDLSASYVLLSVSLFFFSLMRFFHCLKKNRTLKKIEVCCSLFLQNNSVVTIMNDKLLLNYGTKFQRYLYHL